MRDSTERAAIWGAIAVIIAAIITGIFTYISKSSDKVASNTNDHAPYATPKPTTPQPPAESSSNEKLSNNSAPRKMYVMEAEVGEGKSYTDEETGFVFAVDEITDWLNTTGVLSRYTLPDGTSKGMYRWPVGHRVDFQYQGRKFFMVIEDIDYNKKVAKIKIKEMPM